MIDILDLHKDHRANLQKYVYYIIALSVTAIGFTIIRTSDESLHFYHISYGIAVIFWCFSVFKGLYYLRNYMQVIRLNILNYNYKDEFRKYGMESDLKKVFNENIDKLNNKMHFSFRFQEVTFYLGMIAFIVAHIWKMYCNSQV